MMGWTRAFHVVHLCLPLGHEQHYGTLPFLLGKLTEFDIQIKPVKSIAQMEVFPQACTDLRGSWGGFPISYLDQYTKKDLDYL